MTEAIEHWPVGRLKPYDKNSKQHPPEQIEALRASLRTFGFTIPILVREGGTIIAGHGRLEAALLEGFTEVPVIVARGWSDEKCRAYVIADNRLAEMASWDEALLQSELAAIQFDGFDLEAIGFTQADLDAMAEAAAPVEPEPEGLERAASGALSHRFGVPPFSVLNAREGWWQDRKAAWVALGIRSEVGRGENLAITGGDIGPDMDFYRHQKKLAPGRSPLPATDYSKTKARGDGRGRAMR